MQSDTGTFWRWGELRAAERVTLAFYGYTALLALIYPISVWSRAISVAAPLLLCTFWMWAARQPGSAMLRVRDWTIPAAVVCGYWQMGWFAQSHMTELERTWLGWDRQVLDVWGLRTFLEHVPVLAWFLELCYLLLYIVPPACLAVLYQRRAWKQVDKYLLTFASGTLAVYALLPAIPAASPRLAFAAQDVPAIHSVWRDVNVFILDRLDISTSVFPSGHVAVAFASAFGMKRALPGDHTIFLVFFCLACGVYVATIYGRYHYAVDGLASFGISLVTWRVCDRLDPA